MPIQASPPPDQQQDPFLPTGFKPLIFEQFAGINQSTTRAGIPDAQAYWLDGFMPLDARNARTLYGVGSTLYTASGTTVVFYDFINIGSTPYMIVFLANGAVDAVNVSTTAVTHLLNAGSITSPSILNCGLTQWGQQYLIIVANQTNGYWTWDGVNVSTAGSISPVATIANGGSGYTAPITITAVGGYGHGVSLTGSVVAGRVTNVSIVSAGSGYSVNDTVYGVVTPVPVGGSGGSITSSVSGGTLVSLTIAASGSLYGPNTSLVFGPLSPGQIGPAILPILTSGSITGTSITFRGSGLTTGTTGTILITDTAVQASINLNLMPFGVQGTAVETYQGHVWVANGPLIQFTSPGSITDFSTSNGGGNFTSSSSNLKVSYIQLIAANGFLYLIGDSSVDYISGVQTSGSPPTTTFTNLNADPEVGTPFPMSVEVFGRNILFANSFGVQVCLGADVRKVSQMLDGIFNTVSNFGGLQLSSAKATIFGRKVWMVLVKIVDPVTGSTVNKVFMWDGGKKWWTSEQDITLTYIRAQEINSQLTAYGTDGTIVSPMFSTASSGFEKRASSRLWDEPGSYIFTKANGRAWLAANYNSTVTPDLKLTIDNQAGFGATTYTIAGPASTGYFLSPPQAIGQIGQFLGLTMKTNSPDMQFISSIIDADPHDYRG
jgi:hypothetical protein